jgi:hypothetical protein
MPLALRRPRPLPTPHLPSLRPIVRRPPPTAVVGPAKAVVGVAAPLVVVPSAGVEARHGRHSITPGQGPSPCGRARPTCLPSPGPPDCATLRRACLASDSAPTPAPGDPYNDLVPDVWRLGQRLPRRRFQHHSDDPSFLRLGDRLWCLLPHHSHYRHALPLPSPHSSHPSSIVVGNGSTLPVTSVGDSVLPGPFYLNDILVAPTSLIISFLFVGSPLTTLVPLSLTPLVSL